MFHEIPPNEAEINDCLTQLLTDGVRAHHESTVKYAQMRLADFSHVLEEWRNAELAQTIGQPTLPKVALALQSGKLSPEQGAKLPQFLQQASEQGNTTALLYLAYLSAKGLFMKQSFGNSAAFARKAAQQKDWRGTQWLAEMLLAVPEAAPEILNHDAIKTAKLFKQNHPHISDKDLQAACKRFYTSPIAVKQIARQLLKFAAKHGSPTAEQRLRNLIVQGKIPPSPPAKQYCQLQTWLETQFPATPPRELISSGDVDIFPENMPFLPQAESEPEWWQNPKIMTLLISMVVVIVLMWLSTKVMGK